MDRRGFIGGADCVKIMQGEWQELWEVKTGRREPDDLSDNIAVQLGTFTEDFNLQWFEKQYQCVLEKHQWEIEQQIGRVPTRGTIDAAYGFVPVEAKHTNAFNSMNDIIERYMPQIQLYSKLADTHSAYLSVIFGNSKWEARRIQCSNEYFNKMWTVVSDFWSYVEADKPPEDVNVPTINQDNIEVDQMVMRDATQDNQFVDAAVTYIQGYEHNRVFENAKKDLKAMVLPSEREVYCDQLSVRRDKRGALRIVITNNKKENTNE